MSDFPFDDVVKEAVTRIQHGATVHQKFTCANCGTRQTMAEPNKFFLKGICEECKHETDIGKTGCNYLVMFGNVPK
jgi:hypothetical protein